MLDIILNYVIPIIILFIAFEKNEFIFSAIIALYYTILSYFSPDAVAFNLIFYFVLFVLYYIAALISFKSTKLFNIYSPIFFIIVWDVVFFASRYLIVMLLNNIF